VTSETSYVDQAKLIKMTTAQEYLTNIKKELRDYVIPFWMKHSLDTEHGGYFNNLTREGKVFDPTKHIWYAYSLGPTFRLQGRQVWMLSKLYNTKEDFHTEEIKNAAKLGADFLLKHVKRTEDNRVYFSVTRDGKPGSLQRKMFSECLYVKRSNSLTF
jgi:N-acylglucosamine 2-epimerase